MSKFFRTAMAASLLVLLASCGGGMSSDSPVLGPTTMQITDSVVGTGATASTGNTVTISYAGWIYDATQFNMRGAFFGNSASNGASTVFTLGATQVISGIDQGIDGMKVGGTRVLIIPSTLDIGGTKIATPPNEPLVVLIQLLAVQ